MACAETNQISAYLNQIYGENSNKKFELKGSKVLIGRADKANIKLKCLNVSRKHCILSYVDKCWTVKDNNSQNGTWVSGKKLKPGESRHLDCGDIIFLGPPTEMPQAFTFEINYCFENPEISDTNNGMEDILHDSFENVNNSCIGHFSPKETSEKEALPTKSDDEVIIISAEKKSPSEATAGLKTNSDLFSKPISSADCTYKRKLAPIFNTEVSSSLCSNSKKSKYMQSIPIDSQKHVPNALILPDLENQIYEVSSTGSNEVEDSESLLDLKNEDVPDQLGQNIKELESECQSKLESENESLKSRINLMTKKINELEKQRSVYEKRFESGEKKNKILEKQLAEQKKMKADLQTCEQKAKNEIKKEILENLEEDLICHICTELLIKPTVLQCSHTFCEYCIHEWKRKKNECPMCRCKLQTMTRILTLEHFIDKTLETLTPEQREKREEIIKERLMAETQKKNQKSPVKTNYRHRRYRSRRVANARNLAQRNIEMPPRRNLVLPIQLPSVSYPLFLNNPNFRFPEVLISDSERETVNIFVST